MVGYMDGYGDGYAGCSAELLDISLLPLRAFELMGSVEHNRQ